MPRERLFYFVPLEKHKRLLSKDEQTPYARLDKHGTFKINTKCMNDLGFETKQYFFKFFYDLDKRALGFRVVDESVKLADNNEFRLIRPYSFKGGGSYYQVQVKAFISALSNPDLSQRLPIGEYEDNDVINAKVYYVIIPTLKREVKPGELISSPIAATA